MSAAPQQGLRTLFQLNALTGGYHYAYHVLPSSYHVITEDQLNLFATPVQSESVDHGWCVESAAMMLPLFLSLLERALPQPLPPPICKLHGLAFNFEASDLANDPTNDINLRSSIL